MKDEDIASHIKRNSRLLVYTQLFHFGYELRNLGDHCRAVEGNMAGKGKSSSNVYKVAQRHSDLQSAGAQEAVQSSETAVLVAAHGIPNFQPLQSRMFTHILRR